MWLSFQQHAIETHCWANQSEMLDHLRHLEESYVLLGQACEAPSSFDTLTVHLFTGRPGHRRFGVGIVSDSHGLRPTLFIDQRRSVLVVGYSRYISAVDVSRRSILFELECPSVFYSFFCVPSIELLFAVHELGVLAFSPAGERVWSFEDDIITSWNVSSDTVELVLWGGRSVCLRLLDGAVIR